MPFLNRGNKKATRREWLFAYIFLCHFDDGRDEESHLDPYRIPRFTRNDNWYYSAALMSINITYPLNSISVGSSLVIIP